MAERDLAALARSTVAIAKETDDPLPDDESETMGTALRNTVLYLDGEVARLRATMIQVYNRARRERSESCSYEVIANSQGQMDAMRRLRKTMSGTDDLHEMAVAEAANPSHLDTPSGAG